MASPADAGLVVARAGSSAPAHNKALRALLKNPVAVASALVLLLLVCAAVAAPWLAPYEPNRPSLGQRLNPPGAEHWFGTDHYGRDVLSRTIWGRGPLCSS